MCIRDSIDECLQVGAAARYENHDRAGIRPGVRRSCHDGRRNRTTLSSRPTSPYQERPLASARTPRVLPPGMAHARRSALLMLVGLVASSIPLPYTAVAVLPLVWSGVESVRAMRAMSAGGAPTRGIVWSAIGLVMVCVLAVMVALPSVVSGPAMKLPDCTKGAN